MIGIDEAGYGPILGPLVVTASAFLTPDNLSYDMWNLLEDSVGRCKRGLGERLLVTDSKKAYGGTKDLIALEKTVLAFLQQIDIIPANFVEILSAVVGILPQKGNFWHDDIWEEDVIVPETYTKAAMTLTRDLSKNGIDFLGVKSKCLEAKEYNGFLQTCGNNKANLLLGLVSELLYEISIMMNRYEVKRIRIIVDKLGARSNYKQFLEGIFPRNDNFTVVCNDRNFSSYTFWVGDKNIVVKFQAGADDYVFPVSLSSMFSKYIREKIMLCMNRYFARYLPGIKPTAGYWEDGLRFLKDLEENDILQKLGIEKDCLVRNK